jgi:uncharacterized protein YjeT (DUF2065 family)
MAVATKLRATALDRSTMDFWKVLPVAIALVFIIEGLIPFISPGRWRNMLAMVGQMDDRVIRNIGLGSMLFGLAMLYLVN